MTLSHGAWRCTFTAFLPLFLWDLSRTRRRETTTKWKRRGGNTLELQKAELFRKKHLHEVWFSVFLWLMFFFFFFFFFLLIRGGFQWLMLVWWLTYCSLSLFVVLRWSVVLPHQLDLGALPFSTRCVCHLLCSLKDVVLYHLSGVLVLFPSTSGFSFECLAHPCGFCLTCSLSGDFMAVSGGFKRWVPWFQPGFPGFA